MKVKGQMSSPITLQVTFSDRTPHGTWSLLPRLDGQRAEDLPVSAWPQFIAMPGYLLGDYIAGDLTPEPRVCVHDKHSTRLPPFDEFSDRHLASGPCSWPWGLREFPFFSLFLLFFIRSLGNEQSVAARSLSWKNCGHTVKFAIC